MASFDPYHEWLGIAPSNHPPNYYTLLGVEDSESDPDVLDLSAELRARKVQPHTTGPHGAQAAQILRELQLALQCLCNPTQRNAYNAALRSGLLDTPNTERPDAQVIISGPASGLGGSPSRSWESETIDSALPELGDFQCPTCGHMLHLKPKHGGHKVRCRGCRTKLLVAPDLHAIWPVIGSASQEDVLDSGIPELGSGPMAVVGSAISGIGSGDGKAHLCIECGHTLFLKSKHAGHRVHCRKCRTKYRVAEDLSTITPIRET